MAVTSKQVKENDDRNNEREHNLSARADNVNEDGSVSDVWAKKRAEHAVRDGSTAPNQRKPVDHRYGTPQWMQEQAPEGWISDGGPTLHSKEQYKDYEDTEKKSDSKDKDDDKDENQSSNRKSDADKK